MNTVLDSCDIWNSDYIPQSFVFENIDQMITGADEQIVRVLHAQCFSIRCVDSVRLEWASLLQLSNFVCDHDSKLASSSMADKMSLQHSNLSPTLVASAKEATV